MHNADYAEDSEGESPNLSLEAEQARVPVEQPKPTRPKPRPLKKQPEEAVPDSQKMPDRSANSSFDSFADVYAGPSTIADRAKTRERTSRKQTQPAAAAPAIEVLELTSSDDEYDELSSSQPKKTKAKTQPKPKPKVRARDPSPYQDSVYGDGAIPLTFPDAPVPLEPLAPLSNPYSIPQSPPMPLTSQDDIHPPLSTFPPNDNVTYSPKSTTSYGLASFFAASSSSVPFPANADDSGIADMSTVASHSQQGEILANDVHESPKAKKASSAKGKKKDATTKTKKAKEKDKKETEKSIPAIYNDDRDELDAFPTRAVVEIRTSPRKSPYKSSSELSSVPPSDEEVGLQIPKPASKRKNIVESDEEAPVPTKKSKKAPAKKSKGKQVALSNDDEGVDVPPSSKPAKKKPGKAKGKGKAKNSKREQPMDEVDKEIEHTEVSPIPSPALPEYPPSPQPEALSTLSIPSPATPISTPSISTIRRRTSTPMSELIRKVNSQPGSAFISSPTAKTGGNTLAYSPYAKSSRTTLSRIAPLHPNRKPPPPPLPPPPPRRKTKKELEREERWEEELIESAGGMEQWICLTDDERKEMRRAKREMEMSGWED